MNRDYLPRDITFDRPCIEWVWENIKDLQSGIWPASRPSGYTDVHAHVQRGILHAPFETACLVAAEVEMRAKKCGLEGYLVEDRYIRGLSERDIARERGLRVNDVYRRINKVLWYCASGKTPRWLDTMKRPGLSYEEWKRQKSYRNRKMSKTDKGA